MITSQFSEDEHLLVTVADVPCDPMWEEVMKKLFDWANQQGLKGNKVSDLEIGEILGCDPLCPKQYVKCKRTPFNLKE